MTKEMQFTQYFAIVHLGVLIQTLTTWVKYADFGKVCI